MTKKLLRDLFLQKLYMIHPSELSRLSDSIWPTLFKNHLWKNAEALLAYSSINGEINSIPLLKQGFSDGKKIFLPYIDAEGMVFREIFNLNLHKKHSLGFLQPSQDAPLFNSRHFKSVLLVAPAVAANPRGYRLGRGKGFYDRWLALHKKGINTIIILLKDFLVEFQNDSFDIAFDYILSEQGLIKSMPSR